MLCLRGSVFSLSGTTLQPLLLAKLLPWGSGSVTARARVTVTSCRWVMAKPTLGPGIQAFSIPDEVHRDFTELDKILA